MGSDVVKEIDLDSLGSGIPVIPAEAVGFYKQNCMVCFASQEHKSGVRLKVVQDHSSELFGVVWSGEVTEELRRAYADLVRATENAACAMALLLVREITDFTAVEQATRGTTIDYYLRRKMQDDKLIFNDAARLEASGILRQNGANTIDSRIKDKMDRLKPGLPAFIIVVEFSIPLSRIVEA